MSCASCAASVDGAPTAASIGMPASRAFCTSSNDARPDTCSTCCARGSLPSRSAHPITLSTALCLPTSSRTHTAVPSGANRPAACTPPVASKTCCASRSVSGSWATTAASTSGSAASRGSRAVLATASIDSVPQMPHALVVVLCRAAASEGGTAPAPRWASITL